MELFASALIQFKSWDWHLASSGDKAAIISCLCCVGIFTITIFFLLKILRVARSKDLFEDKPYLRRYSAITEGYKTSTKTQLSMQFVLTLRRFTLVALVVYDSLVMQILGNQFMMILVLIYLGHTRASWTFRYDMMHEFFILVQASLLPVYNDYVWDPVQRYTIGYVSSALFVAQLGIILFFLFWGTIKGLIAFSKRCCNKIKRKCMQAKKCPVPSSSKTLVVDDNPQKDLSSPSES